MTIDWIALLSKTHHYNFHSRKGHLHRYHIYCHMYVHQRAWKRVFGPLTCRKLPIRPSSPRANVVHSWLTAIASANDRQEALLGHNCKVVGAAETYVTTALRNFWATDLKVIILSYSRSIHGGTSLTHHHQHDAEVQEHRRAHRLTLYNLCCSPSIKCWCTQ